MAQPSLRPKSTKSSFQNLIKRIWQNLKSSSQRASHSMLQPSLQPESSITFFPLRFEEYIYNHWYLFSIGLYLLLMILGVSLDVAYAYYFQHPGFYYILYDFHSTYLYRDLTDWIYILGVVAISLIVVAFNSWRWSIHPIFQALISKRRLRSTHNDRDVNQEYRCFLENYQQALLSKKRYFLLGAIIIIFLGYILWSMPQVFSYYSSIAREKIPLLGILGFIRYVVGTPLALLLEGYFLATGTWVLCITGMYVRKLAKEFNFNIQSAHADHCGGLKALGNLCLGIALPILILAMLLALYSICGLLLPLSGLLEPILADILLIPFVLPLAAIAFFVPLWKIHQKMISERDTEADTFSDRVVALKETIESSLDRENLEEAKAAKEKLEIIQALHSDSDSYPIWPFDRSILLKFLAPQIVSVLSLLIQLGPIVDALKYIFRVT